MKPLLRRIASRFARPVMNQLSLASRSGLMDSEPAAQKVLMQQYRMLRATDPDLLPDLKDVGFKKFSQFEEDGILLYIFSLIKPINRTCVEMCAGVGSECNTANLIINHGWWGHLFDGDAENVRAGEQFFASNTNTVRFPPRYSHAWITAENVNDLLLASGVSGPVDLLSLDLDGVDYWIWKAIEAIDPQVVVCETHNSIPADYAWTVPYRPDFVFESEDFRGQSLAAMAKLGREKGYRLIGTHRYGFNAFFMKEGVGEDVFPEVSVAECLSDPYTAAIIAERWETVRQLPWVEV